MEKRKCTRLACRGLIAELEGDSTLPSCSVLDISDSGICLADDPKVISSHDPNLRIIVSGHGEEFRLQIRTRWSVVDGWRKASGASIDSPSKKWRDFVEKQRKDIKKN